MKFTQLLAGAALIAVSFVSPHAAAMDAIAVGPLKIERAWTRATPKSAKAGGGYLTITNTGAADDRLVAAGSDRADMVQIHEMKMTDGVMTMRQVAGGLALPAGQVVELRPGGLHIMMMGLKTPIAEGDAVSLTLMFERAGSVDIEMIAAPLGAKKPPAGHAGH